MPHILIIDDNPGDIELIRTAFEIAGVEALVDTCHDGIEAMRFITQTEPGGELPTLLLLDLNMPRANGFEVLAFLRERHLVERIPVVVLSTSAQAGDRQRCLALGARKMYTKPESFPALRLLIGELKDYLTEPATDGRSG
jgi:CheY-like chemotaxis protein